MKSLDELGYESRYIVVRRHESYCCATQAIGTGLYKTRRQANRAMRKFNNERFLWHEVTHEVILVRVPKGTV